MIYYFPQQVHEDEVTLASSVRKKSVAAGAAADIAPHAAQAAALLKALANEQRLMILCNLVEGAAVRQRTE